jgi:hypothetical protein
MGNEMISRPDIVVTGKVPRIIAVLFVGRPLSLTPNFSWVQVGGWVEELFQLKRFIVSGMGL